MSKDVIERAIKKAQGGDAENYEEVRYEGFGPGGVAIIVEALTDNRNRTAADVRAAFSKYGGAMGENPARSRSCSSRVGCRSSIPATSATPTPCWKRPSRRAPTNPSPGSEGHEFLCRVEDFAAVRDALEAKLGPPQSAQDRLAARAIRCRSTTMPPARR